MKLVSVMGVLLMASLFCGCGKNAAGNQDTDTSSGLESSDDSDDSTDTSSASADADTDTDTDTDSDVDSESELPDADELTGNEISPDIDWIQIPAGSFIFGSAEGEPCSFPSEKQVPVTLTHPFVIASTEITQTQWSAMDFSHSSWTTGPDKPVTLINFLWSERGRSCHSVIFGHFCAG